MTGIEIVGVPQSNYVWTCRIAAEEKGVAYKLTPARPHSPEACATHPFGKIPSMRHGDVVLCESQAIAVYINRAFEGPALMPQTVPALAQALQWISLVNTTVDPLLVRQYALGGYFFSSKPDGTPNRELIETLMPKVEQHLGVLAKAVAGDGHLAGGSFTIADMTLLPILYYASKLPESGAALARQSALQAYLDRHMARASVKATIPPPMSDLKKRA